jgi:hypothetical protein
MFKTLALALVCCSSAALADGSTSPGGYTTLQAPTIVVQTVSAPQYFFVPSMRFQNCCCGTISFIAGMVITTPSIETTSWGANG